MKLLLTFQRSSLACVSFLEIHTELWGRHLIGTPLRLGFMSPLQPTHHFVSLLHGQPTVRKMTAAHSHHHVMFCFSELPLLGYNLVSGLNVRSMPDDPAKTQHQPIRCRRRLLWVVWQTSAFPKNWPLNFTEHSKLAIVFVFFCPHVSCDGDRCVRVCERKLSVNVSWSNSIFVASLMLSFLDYLNETMWYHKNFLFLNLNSISVICLGNENFFRVLARRIGVIFLIKKIHKMMTFVFFFKHCFKMRCRAIHQKSILDFF